MLDDKSTLHSKSPLAGEQKAQACENAGFEQLGFQLPEQWTSSMTCV
jgi:hypothetical protein